MGRPVAVLATVLYLLTTFYLFIRRCLLSLLLKVLKTATLSKQPNKP